MFLALDLGDTLIWIERAMREEEATYICNAKWIFLVFYFSTAFSLLALSCCAVVHGVDADILLATRAHCHLRLTHNATVVFQLNMPSIAPRCVGS